MRILALVCAVVAFFFVASAAGAQAPSASPAIASSPRAPAHAASSKGALPESARGVAPAPSGSAAQEPAAPPAEGAPGEESPPNPHAKLTPDANELAPDLPVGTIEVTVVDADNRPLAGVDVRLGILSQKISEGEQRTSKTAKSDTEGHARFSGLAATNDKSYRATVQSGAAEYGSTPFNLRDNAGMRVLLHVYPSTSDMSRTVALGAFVSVEPRDDLFQLEMVLHVFNVSKLGWIPNDVLVELPEGFKAFSPEESMFDTRFEAVEGRGAALRGTFPPGEHRVRFRFQIPKPAESEISFSLGLPPRVAQAQVIAAASPEMTLEVRDGFPPPEASKSQQGDRVLYTMRMIKRGEEPIRNITVTLTGLRVPSLGRWVAVAIALVFAGLGGLAARGDIHIASAEKVQGDRSRARDLILQELVALERARASSAVGPSAYDRAHRALLDALARIGVPEEKKQPKKRKTARA